MCYGGEYACSRRTARTRSRGRRKQRDPPPIRPGRLHVCHRRCGPLRNHVARWGSRGGSGVGFRTPARARTCHSGLASGAMRSRTVNSDGYQVDPVVTVTSSTTNRERSRLGACLAGALPPRHAPCPSSLVSMTASMNSSSMRSSIRQSHVERSHEGGEYRSGGDVLRGCHTRHRARCLRTEAGCERRRAPTRSRRVRPRLTDWEIRDDPSRRKPVQETTVANCRPHPPVPAGLGAPE